MDNGYASSVLLELGCGFRLNRIRIGHEKCTIGDSHHIAFKIIGDTASDLISIEYFHLTFTEKR